MVWSLNREAFLMRAHKVLNYELILQVLGEPGCPFCRFMKNFQTALLQDPEREVHYLCNFHTWGHAATQHAVSAAEHFLSLLREQSGEVPGFFLHYLHLIKRKKIFESANLSATASISSLHNGYDRHAVLCMVRGAKLKYGAPQIVVSAINAIMERCRRQLVEDLTRLHTVSLPDAERWGVLGRAAELMVSQRGLHTKKG
jgi:hypothetical protein